MVYMYLPISLFCLVTIIISINYYLCVYGIGGVAHFWRLEATPWWSQLSLPPPHECGYWIQVVRPVLTPQMHLTGRYVWSWLKRSLVCEQQTAGLLLSGCSLPFLFVSPFPCTCLAHSPSGIRGWCSRCHIRKLWTAWSSAWWAPWKSTMRWGDQKS